MRNRLIALALLVIAIVVLAEVFTHRGSSNSPPAIPLTTIAPATVTRLVAKKLGEPFFVLRRQGQKWNMLAPKKARANAERINFLLAALVENTTNRYPVGSINLVDAGLNPPAYTLTANGVQLEFGRINPATLLRYVRRGDTVYTVMDHIAPLLAAGPTAFLAPPITSAPHAGTAGG